MPHLRRWGKRFWVFVSINMSPRWGWRFVDNCGGATDMPPRWGRLRMTFTVRRSNQNENRLSLAVS
jgi:hypothetical protein